MATSARSRQANRRKSPLHLADLDTPALLLDRARLDRNLERMRTHLARFPGVRLRPHLKTAKSIDVARLVTAGPITVSTLKEAEMFAEAGYSDMLYAVGLSPAKLPRVARLADRGVAMTLILDNIAAATAVADFVRAQDARLGVLIEIDADGKRGGLTPTDPAVVEVGHILSAAGVLRGVMTHCGGSYAARSDDALRACAAQERGSVTAAAAMLRNARLDCPVVSLGSTPTVLFATDLAGVTAAGAGGKGGGRTPPDRGVGGVGHIRSAGGVRRGVMTHCGGSYAARSDDALRACAAQERGSVTAAAAMLRNARLDCPVVSLGSTPTVLFATDLAGVTEVRAGVYMFQDLVMAGIGVCPIDDIALSVLVTVIGHRPAQGHVIVDGGWMAMRSEEHTSELQSLMRISYAV